MQKLVHQKNILEKLPPQSYHPKLTSFKTLFEESNDAVLIIDIENNRYVYCNDKMEKLSGFSRAQILSMKVGDMTTDHKKQTPANFEGLDKDQSVVGTNKLVTAKGDVIPIKYSSSVASLNGKKYTVNILHDIREETRAEKELLDLSRFPSEDPNPVLRVNKKGNILYANEASDELLVSWRTSHGEIDIPKKLLHIIKNSDSKPSKKFIEIAGKEKIHLFTIVAIPQTNYVNLYGQDITMHKKQAGKLIKLNRILTAHNFSNQARLKSNNETAYLEEVCRIIAEECEHKMVWVSFAKDTANKTIEPMAQFGFAEGYIETLDLTWSDSLRGQGPTGTAIRTGKISLCRNMQTDSKFAPWREEAKKHGYQSAIAFPFTSITTEEKAFGALTIYSKEPNAFTDEEVRLISDLVIEISNGIIALQMEKVHKKDEAEILQSEERYHSLFRQMAEGFALYEIIYDKDGNPNDYRFLEVNRAFEKLTGLKRANILYRLQSSVLPGEDPLFVKMYGEVAKTRKPVNFTQYSKILERHYDIIAFSPEEGKFATLTNDVTEQKQAEEAKNNFIAVMAHELRNPLMPISMNAELLSDYFQENSDKKKSH